MTDISGMSEFLRIVIMLLCAVYCLSPAMEPWIERLDRRMKAKLESRRARDRRALEKARRRVLAELREQGRL